MPALLDVLDTQHPPALDMKNRRERWSLDELRNRCETQILHSDSSAKHALWALLHLWHDHWESAHHFAQAREGEIDCDLVHALVHRREGDASNSRYWFAAVGSHPVYPDIAAAVSPLLAGTAWEARLLRHGQWQAKAMVDAACSHPRDDLLIAVQGLEYLTLAKHWWPKTDTI